SLATNRMQDTIALVFTLMKFSLSLALFAVFLLVSCSEEPPPPTTRQRPAKYPATETAEYPPPQQPLNPNGLVQPSGAPPVETAPSPPPTAAPTTVAKGASPYEIPVTSQR